MVPTSDEGSPAPIDRPILEHLRDRLETTRQFVNVRITDEDGHLELRATLQETYYPDEVIAAELFVRWYTNDDFKIHYRERHSSGEWECRWDRHPNPHNTRGHFHPPPTAQTPGRDEQWPDDYRDVIQLLLDEIERRIQVLWSESGKLRDATVVGGRAGPP